VMRLGFDRMAVIVGAGGVDVVIARSLLFRGTFGGGWSIALNVDAFEASFGACIARLHTVTLAQWVRSGV
jgi:hypothetical protein